MPDDATHRHPDFAQGFDDAADIAPLHYGRSVEYRWGWICFYRCDRAYRRARDQAERGR